MLLVVPGRPGGRNSHAAQPAVVHSLWCFRPGVQQFDNVRAYAQVPPVPKAPVGSLRRRASVGEGAGVEGRTSVPAGTSGKGGRQEYRTREGVMGDARLSSRDDTDGRDRV